MTNREIKFRGKRLDTGEWAYGWLQVIDGRAYIKSSDSNKRFGMGLEVDPDTVGQKLTVKDRDGGDVYEGDLLDFDELEWGGPFTPDCLEMGVDVDAGVLSDVSQWRRVVRSIHDTEF